MNKHNAHCLNMIQENDRALYASLLFLSQEQRQSASVLQAFHLEIGRIAFLVRETLPGEIRLQWWRDVINAEREGEAKANPLASGLLDIISKHDLARDGFIRYLDARVFDLYNDPMPDRETLEAYFGETESFIFHMTALMNGATDSFSLADSCGHAGVAVGMTRLLTRLSYDRQRQRCFIAKTDLQQAELDVEQWYADIGPRHNRVVTAQLEYAGDHLEKAKKAIKQLPKEIQPGFLPLVISAETLNWIGKSESSRLLNNHVNKPSMLRLQWGLWKTAMFGF